MYIELVKKITKNRYLRKGFNCCQLLFSLTKHYY